MTIPGIRLAAWSCFWRAAVLVFLGAQVRLWLRIRDWNFPSAWHAARPFVRKSPGYLGFALAAAVLATLAAAVLVRLVIAPQVRRWLRPRTDETYLFGLAAREAVITESPARRAVGRSGAAGVLVRTNQRLWFVPAAWDAQPWSVPLDGVREVRTVPSPPVLWGLVAGVPDRLEVRDDAGRRETFAVPDPASLMDWFAERRAPRT
jgi:hypothetical protein